MSLEKIDELTGLKARIDNKAVPSTWFDSLDYARDRFAHHRSLRAGFGGSACAQDIAIGLIRTQN
jgi:hypothetical protein